MSAGHLHNAPVELWLGLLLIILLALFPVVCGSLFFKVFRYFKPIPKTGDKLMEDNRDGFIKKYFVGWLIVSLFAYLFYSWFTQV